MIAKLCVRTLLLVLIAGLQAHDLSTVAGNDKAQEEVTTKASLSAFLTNTVGVTMIIKKVKTD